MILKTIILASRIFNDFNATLIIAGLSVLFFLLLSRLMCWRRKAGNAFYAAAKFAPSDAIRTRYARKGVLVDILNKLTPYGLFKLTPIDNL